MLCRDDAIRAGVIDLSAECTAQCCTADTETPPAVVNPASPWLSGPAVEAFYGAR